MNQQASDTLGVIQDLTRIHLSVKKSLEEGLIETLQDVVSEGTCKPQQNAILLEIGESIRALSETVDGLFKTCIENCAIQTTRFHQG